MANTVRYISAVVGGLLIFGGVFLICGIFITPNLPEFLRCYVHVGPVGTNNLLGLALGLAAASSSFRATLRTKN